MLVLIFQGSGEEYEQVKSIWTDGWTHNTQAIRKAYLKENSAQVSNIKHYSIQLLTGFEDNNSFV